MNKLVWLCLGLLFAGLLKIGFDLEQVQKQQLQVLNLSLEQQKQRLDRLNDQLIALNGQVNQANNSTSTVRNSASIENNTALPTLTQANAQVNPQHLLLEHLQLVQLTIQQQDYSAALAQIQDLRSYVEQKQPLSESLNAALVNALVTDQANLVSFVQQQNTQQSVLLQQLHAIEREIQPKALDTLEKKWQWSSWFSLSKSERVPDLKNHALHYQYIKLQLLLAQQALNAGQVVFYQTLMQEIVADVLHYPDDLSKTLAVNLNKLADISLVAQPKLSALSLLQGG